ncbi:hypothetical protein B0H34DRAFT_799961 [Crassisporium funariophilum]|nr:hypothetical protein B0H34DRAFT_799961 [Crassisporium funariophilum]
MFLSSAIWLTLSLSGLEGGLRLKAHHITAIAKESWNNMTLDEQKLAVAPGVAELMEMREIKSLAKCNVSLSAFGNVNKTLENLEHQIQALHAHTSTEIVLLAVRSNVDHYNPPHAIISSPCMSEFFDLAV